MTETATERVERRDDRSSRERVSRLGKTVAEVESATRDSTSREKKTVLAFLFRAQRNHMSFA